MGATRLSQDRAAPPEAAQAAEIDLHEGAVEVDLDAGIRALRVATDRFTALVRAIEDPALKTKGLDWTLADTAAHVLLTLRYDHATMVGSRKPYPLEDDDLLATGRRRSAEMLRAEPERDTRRIADLIDEEMKGFIGEVERRDARAPALLAGNNAMTVANLVGTILGEMILHGYDIARTIDRHLAIDPDAARLAVYATTATLPLAVDTKTTASVDARLEMRIRGGESFVIHIDHGTARTEPPGKTVDLYMSADPIAYLLVGFGRSGPLGQVLRGRMFSWGRRPWLAAKLPVFFRNP